MKFEWDEEKNQTNIRKHGIAFHNAIGVFSDQNRIERFDIEHSDIEDRWLTIGMVKNILVVIYTERGDVTRLISARKANREEEYEYYKNNNR